MTVFVRQARPDILTTASPCLAGRLAITSIVCRFAPTAARVTARGPISSSWPGTAPFATEIGLAGRPVCAAKGTGLAPRRGQVGLRRSGTAASTRGPTASVGANLTSREASKG